MNNARISVLLEGALDPQRRVRAEEELTQEESKPGFSRQLLDICSDPSESINTRLSGALYFKNLVRRKWRREDGTYLLPAPEVAEIKGRIVDLMIQAPGRVKAQMGEAIGLIADSDFPNDWSDLPKNLAGRLDAENVSTTIGVLEVAQAITHRWRPLVGSNALNAEINLVLNDFSKPFLQCIGQTYAKIVENRNDRQKLKELYLQTHLAMQIMYDLACQDLPPVYEDNQDHLTEMLHLYLTLDVTLDSDDDPEATIIEVVRGDICDLACLFATKYYEDFTFEKLGRLIDDTSRFLVNVGPQQRYDLLVSKALHFLVAVCSTNEFVQRFSDKKTLGEVIEKVILPNIALRDTDIELFDDEPVEFVRRDLEGSDSDTRRRAATDLLNQFSKFFSQMTTNVSMQYVERYLLDYQKDRSANWKSKDSAVYLFSAVAAAGSITTELGVRTVNPLVDVIDFFAKHVSADLSSSGEAEHMVKVDAIKYLYTFRSQLSKEQWHQALPALVLCLNDPNNVISTYATIAIERVLALSSNARDPIFSREDVNRVAKDLINHLLQMILKQESPQKVQENEFWMRCIMRIIFVIKWDVLPLAPVILDKIVEITRIICTNPSNPKFYYYHFEALGALIRYAAASDPDRFENALVNPFDTIIQSEVQEFTPYLFQLLAALLEANRGSHLPATYQAFILPLLAPSLWVRGNVPALTRLMSSIIARDGAGIVSQSRLEPMLGIFQHLLNSKATESSAFDLLEAIINHVSPDSLQPYWRPILSLILQRLQTSKTDNLCTRFTRFYCLVAAKVSAGLGADLISQLLEDIQTGIFTQIYLSIILKQVPLLKRNIDRKSATVGLARSAAESEAFASRYPKGWAYTVNAVLSLLENPPIIDSSQPGPQTNGSGNSITDGSGSPGTALQDLDAEGQGFGAGFTQLASCTRAPEDPFPETGPDLRHWLGAYFKEVDQQLGGRLSTFATERLTEQSRQMLLSYMA